MFNILETPKFLLLFVVAVQPFCAPIAAKDPSCQLLEQIKKSIDETVDPCMDFYGYACNNWPHAELNYEQLLDKQINEKLIAVMENLQNDTLQTDFFNKTHINYQSCLKANVSERILSYLQLIKPGENLEWPILEVLSGKSRREWPAERFNMFELLGRLFDLGLNYIIMDTDVKLFGNLSAEIRLGLENTPSLEERWYHILPIDIWMHKNIFIIPKAARPPLQTPCHTKNFSTNIPH